MDIDFEWDETKRQANRRKHGVDFADAVEDEYDFTDSQRGAIVKSNKERITIRLDADIIEWFRGRVRGGGNYQTLINEALREHMERQNGADLETTLRRVLREELKAANP
jgi:uncharacterized protein (DUF4415 family)